MKLLVFISVFYLASKALGYYFVYVYEAAEILLILLIIFSELKYRRAS